MHLVSKLVFNTLASHRSINLLGVGSLVVERTPSKTKGSGKVIPARNTVIFQRWGEPGADNILELIIRGGADRSQAADHYSEWLDKLGLKGAEGKSLQHFIIPGVGEVNGNEFLPFAALEALLNPGLEEVVEVHPQPRRQPGVLLAAALVLVAVVGVWALYPRGDKREGRAGSHSYATTATNQSGPSADKASARVQAAPAKADGTGASKQQTSQPAKQAAQTEALQPTKPATQVPASQPGVKPAAQPSASQSEKKAEQPAKPATQPAAEQPKTAQTAQSGTYYLVIGFYSTIENANRAIAEQQAKDPGLDYTIVPRGSKFIISGYSSTSEAQVQAKLKELSGRYPSAWIYSKK